MKCDFCGSTHKIFNNHYERHVIPPRIINICKRCHSGLKGHHKKGRTCGVKKRRSSKIHAVCITVGEDAALGGMVETGMYISKSELVRDAVRRLLEEKGFLK